MSTPSSTQEPQRAAMKDVLGANYTYTEEEMRVLKECHQESFYYRALPLSIIGMVITRNLIARGFISASTKYGSLPKVAFAGICGYIAGKLSYLKKCQEKFKNLPNSQVGELVRQRAGMSQFSAQPEQSDPNFSSYDTMFQPAETRSDMSSFTTGDGQMGQPGDTPVQSFEDEEPKKSIFYEDLRLKNRENYEVMLNQKADTVIKASSEKEPERPKKPVMKNIYGDIVNESAFTE